MYMLAILIKLLIYLLFITRILRWCHKIQSGPGVDELLQFFIASVNFTLENGSYSGGDFKEISSNNCTFIFWFWAELKVWYGAC